jgi:hypothetical protein
MSVDLGLTRTCFVGIPTLEVDKTFDRMGLTPSVVGYEHVCSLSNKIQLMIAMLICLLCLQVTSSLQYSGKSLMTDGDVRTCLAIQPRLLGCLIKLLDETMNPEYRRKSILDLWRSLLTFKELNCHSETLGTCIRSLMSICAKSLA